MLLSYQILIYISIRKYFIDIVKRSWLFLICLNKLFLVLKIEIHHFQSTRKQAANSLPPSLAHPPDSLSDSVLLWLSGELSEEEVALLVLALRLRRSAAQLVKLRAGDSLPTQAFLVLAMWRRGLPAATHQPKASQLAQCLAKSGRPDLARELLLRQAAASRQGSLRPGSLKSRNHTDF